MIDLLNSSEIFLIHPQLLISDPFESSLFSVMASTKRGERLKGKNAIITGAAGWVQ